MEKSELEKLVSLRMWLVEKYQSLEGGDSAANSQMRQAECAQMLEKAVRDLDSVLSNHVLFA